MAHFSTLTHHLHNKVAADGTLLRRLLEARVEVVLLAVHLAVHIVESLAPERTAAGAADKAGRVVQVAHSLAGLTCAAYLVTAGVAHACGRRGRGLVVCT